MASEIHADPLEFRRVANELHRIAQEVRRGGDRLLVETSDARSYEGQYAPWVQAIAGEGDHRTRTLSERFVSLAHKLDRIAQAFEEADNLDHKGFPHLADQFRAIIESGSNTSSFPLWLIRGQCPSWLKSGLWNHFLPEDQDAYLNFIVVAWQEFTTSGDYSHGTEQDTWNAFLVYLFIQGIFPEPPNIEVWVSAARASGMSHLEMVTASWLIMRNGPGSGNNKLAEIPQGRVVTWTGNTKLVNGTEWHEVFYDGKRGWVSSKYLTEYVPPENFPPLEPGHVWVEMNGKYSFSYYVVTDVDSYDPLATDPTIFGEMVEIKWKWGGPRVEVPFGSLFSKEGVAMQGSGVVTIDGERTLFTLDNPNEISWQDADGNPVTWDPEKRSYVTSSGAKSHPETILNPEDAHFTLGSKAEELTDFYSVAGAYENKGKIIYAPAMEKHTEFGGVFKVEDAGGAFSTGEKRFDVFIFNKEEGDQWYSDAYPDRLPSTIYFQQAIPSESR